MQHRYVYMEQNWTLFFSWLTPQQLRLDDHGTIASSADSSVQCRPQRMCMRDYHARPGVEMSKHTDMQADISRAHCMRGL